MFLAKRLALDLVLAGLLALTVLLEAPLWRALLIIPVLVVIRLRELTLFWEISGQTASPSSKTRGERS